MSKNIDLTLNDDCVGIIAVSLDGVSYRARYEALPGAEVVEPRVMAVLLRQLADHYDLQTITPEDLIEGG